MDGPATPASGCHDAASQRAKIFVSYSRRDAAFAASLVAHLETRAFHPFLDRTDIAPGEPWQDRLAGLIRVADTMVFVVSPDSARSTICEWEIGEAVRLGKRIIPLVCRPTDDAAIPPSLGRLNFIFATEEADISPALAKLEDGLRQDLDWVREHTRLTEIAVRWDAGGRRRSQALRGGDLDGAERWLAHQPGDASQPTALHRDLVVFSRRAQRVRQRAWVGGSMAVAIIAIGLAGFAELSRRRADDALQAARGTANTLVTDLAGGLRDKVGMPITLVRGILQPALALQDRLISTAGVSPALRADQSHALAEMSDTLLRIGDTQEALKTAARSRDIADMLLRASPKDPNLRSHLSESLYAVTLAEEQAGDLPAAHTAVTRLVGLAREDAGTNPTQRHTLALLEALSNLGRMEAERYDYASAASTLEEAYQVAQAGSAYAAKPRYGKTLIGVLVELSLVRLRAGDPQRALEALREAHVLATKNAADETDAEAKRDLATTLVAMAVSFYSLNDPASAFASIDQSLRIRRELAADKDNYGAQLALARALFATGGLRSSNGLTDEGIRDFEESIATYRPLARDGSHPVARIELANTLNIFAEIKATSPARSGEAIAELAEAIELYHASQPGLDEHSMALFRKAESHLATLRTIQTQ
jgi:tetratricopeptide (TPR) repeat protein